VLLKAEMNLLLSGKEWAMEIAIAVTLLVNGGLSALMIYGIVRLWRRNRECALVARPPKAFVGRLYARTGFQVNENADNTIGDVLAARLFKEKYGYQE